MVLNRLLTPVVQLNGVRKDGGRRGMGYWPLNRLDLGQVGVKSWVGGNKTTALIKLGVHLQAVVLSGCGRYYHLFFVVVRLAQ